MSTDKPAISIKTVYLNLVEIITNDAKVPLNQVGSYVVGSTIAEDGVDDLYKDYPTLEQIADIGSELEYQGEEYAEAYYQQLKSLIVKLEKEISTLS